MKIFFYDGRFRSDARSEFFEPETMVGNFRRGRFQRLENVLIAFAHGMRADDMIFERIV
jgi:hypothetical protein